MSEAEHLSNALSGLFTNSQNGWIPPFADAISGLTVEKAVWKPEDTMHSVWEIVNHVRFWHDVVRLRIEHRPVDRDALGAADGWPPVKDTNDHHAWHEACEQAAAANRELATVAAALSDVELTRPTRGSGAAPWQLVHGLIAHTAYHTGQAVVIRRLQGAWIVDWRERQRRSSRTDPSSG